MKKISVFVLSMLLSLGAVATPVFVTSSKNAQLDTVTTSIGNAGLLVIGTSALSGATGVLCTITLSSPVAASAASGVLTFSGMPKTCTASATGTAAKVELRTSGGTTIVSGLTVGLSGSGADIIVDNTSYGNTQVYTLNSLTLSK